MLERVSWSDDLVALVKDLRLNKKLTAGMISKELERLGYTLSRSAVIGKLGRLGLMGKHGPQIKNQEQEEERRRLITLPAHPPQFASSSNPPAEDDDAHADPAPTPPPAPPGPRCTLFDLDKTKCHWPLEGRKDGLTTFCGKPLPPGSSRPPYCTAHRRLNYRR